MKYTGELLSFFCAFSWAITAILFTSASKKLGTISVNFIRLIFAFILLGLTLLFKFNYFIPPLENSYAWFWLSISGFIGFILGDLFLFKSYIVIGVNKSRLIMTLVPIFTFFLGLLILKETVSIKQVFGIIITISGIIFAIINKDVLKNKYSTIGIIYAILGAFGQALGFVLSKFGLKNIDPFSAVQIRLLAGIVGFIILLTVLKKWKTVANSLKDTSSLLKIFTGSFIGVYLGVSFALLAITYTKVSIASTIMGTVPIILIPISIIFLKYKANIKEIIGAFISVLGITIFFI